MSKPELPGGQSLEEILANIRKTLSDDGPDEGLSRLDVGEAAAAPEPASANGTAPARDTLPDQLAVALNGVPNGHADDAELTDLLASEISAASAPKPRADDNAGRDPLWFLSRAPAGEPAPKAKPEEIELTRPETLRRSFPPLFGNGESTQRPLDVPVERVKPAEPVVAKDVPVPDAAAVAKPISAAAAATLAEIKPAKFEAAPASAKPVEPEVRAPAAATNGAGEPAAVAVKSEPVAVKPEPAAEAKPVSREAPVADTKAAVATPAPAEAKSAAADAGKDMQGQALQDMIARLLEPVIKQWLDANLPRMVEAAIREEVARQSKGPRSELEI